MASNLRLTLLLTAQDTMSKVVQNAANRSLASMQTFQARAQQIQSQARQGMFDAGIATAGGVAALAYPLKMAANYETLRVKMVALTGSQAEGARIFQQVIKLASETPLNVEEIGTATSRLMGFGRSAKDAIVDVKMLGDVVMVAGGDIQAAMVAYGQAAGEGRLMTRDLTQLVNAGVPIFKMLSESTGKTAREIKGLAETGQLSFDILQQTFAKATGAGGQFENGMKIMSATSKGLFARLADEAGRVGAVFGNSVLPALKSFGEALIPILDSTAKFIENNQWLAKTLVSLVMAFTAVSASLFLYNGAVWAASFGTVSLTGAVTWASWQFFRLRYAIYTSGLSLASLGTALQFVRVRIITAAIATYTGFMPAVVAASTAVWGWVTATYAFTAAMLSMPIIGWAVALVAAIIALGVAIYKNWDAIVAFFDGMWQKFKDFLPKAKSWGVNLIQSIKDGIVSAAPTLFNAIDGVMKFTRGFFPSSPAKRGAFKDIQRIKIIEQVAKNIKPNSLASAVGNATRGAVGSIGGGSSSPAIAPVNSGGGGSVQVNYSPSITIGGGGGEAEKQSFMAMLERHKDEVLKLVNETQRTQQRRAYA